MLNLDEVLTFKAVADCGNFTVAANQLHVTQSTISHQIKRLEEQLGQKLFVRTTRSVKLTLAGERFLPYASSLIEMSRMAEQSLSVESITGELRIGVPEEFAYHHLVELLNRFRLHYPHVALAVEVGLSSVLTEKLQSGDLDVVLVKEVPAKTGAIHREPLVWAGKQSLLQSESVPLAFYPGPCAFRSAAIDALESSGIGYSVILISASLEALRIASAAGTVVSVMTFSQCPAELRLPIGEGGLPELGDMGYRLKLGDETGQPARIVVEIIEELLGH